VSFFGYYLVEKGLVNVEQVLLALDQQRDFMTPIGHLARRENLLSEEAVFQVLERQQETHRPFGATAMELGLLTQDEVGDLLRAQMKRPAIGELLVEMGAIDRGTLERELHTFEETHKNIKEPLDFD